MVGEQIAFVEQVNSQLPSDLETFGQMISEKLSFGGEKKILAELPFESTQRSMKLD